MNSENPESKKGKGLGKRVKSALIAATALTALGGAGYGAYETIPQVRSTIESIIGGESTVPLTFDDNLDKSVVQAGINAVPATTKDINNLAKDNIVPSSVGSPLPEITLILPAILQTGDRVTITKDHYTPQISINTATGEQTEYPSLVRYRELNISRKGTPISSGIVDSKIKSAEVFRREPWVVDGVPIFNGIIIFVEREDGSKYEADIYTAGDVRSLVPLPIVGDAPFFEHELVVENGHQTTRIKPNQKGKSIDLSDPSQPLLQTDSENTLVSIRLANLSSQNPVKGFSDISFAVDDNAQLIYPR